MTGLPAASATASISVTGADGLGERWCVDHHQTVDVVAAQRRVDCFDVVGRCRAEVELPRSVDRPQPARHDRPRREALRARVVGQHGDTIAAQHRLGGQHSDSVEQGGDGRHLDQPAVAVQGAVRRSEVGARAHGDDGPVLRDPSGDPGESTRVAEVFGVHADHVRRVIVLEELQQVGGRDVGAVSE